MLTVVPNVVCKQPTAMFSAIKSWFGSSSQEKETKQPNYLEPKGLRNFGTTCYFNSMIQALSTGKFFRKEISQSSNQKNAQTKTLNDLFSYMDNTNACLKESQERELMDRYKKLLEFSVWKLGQERPPSEALNYLKILYIPSDWLPEEISLDINGDDIYPIEPTQAVQLPPEKAKYSYLYNWTRVNEIEKDYNDQPVPFTSRITAPRPNNYSTGNYLSNDFKLKCIICYDNDRHHYYVVKEHRKNWFEISDNEVKLAVECKRKNEETIITELNEKYDKKILMAFYDYDPE